MKKKYFLVLDTNIWVYSNGLLGTALGAAVIYSLNQSKGKLALPEVIEEEIRKHTLKRGCNAVEIIHKHYRLLEQLMGARDDYKVPSNEDLLARVDSRLFELGDLIHRVGFSMPHAKSALIRVLEESPPNGYKNQQFKDSVIWESILELTIEADVDFVTEDNAFFQDSKPNKGLANNLMEDSKRMSGNIRIFNKLSDYLNTIKEETPLLDKLRIIEKINKSIHTQLCHRAVDKGYKLGEINHNEIQAFLTERSEVVAIEFELSYLTSQVLLPETETVVDAILIVKGHCECNILSYDITDIEFNNIRMITKEGVDIPQYGNIFLKVSSIYSGRQAIPYKLKEPLD